jgi:hypothetical protein
VNVVDGETVVVAVTDGVGGGVMVSVAVISLVGDRVLLGVPEDEADEDAVEVGDGVGGGVMVSVIVNEADGDREFEELSDAVKECDVDEDGVPDVEYVVLSERDDDPEPLIVAVADRDPLRVTDGELDEEIVRETELVRETEALPDGDGEMDPVADSVLDTDSVVLAVHEGLSDTLPVVDALPVLVTVLSTVKVILDEIDNEDVNEREELCVALRDDVNVGVTDFVIDAISVIL